MSTQESKNDIISSISSSDSDDFDEDEEEMGDVGVINERDSNL